MKNSNKNPGLVVKPARLKPTEKYTDLEDQTSVNYYYNTINKPFTLFLQESSTGIDLDIFEKQLILDSEDPLYHLDVSFFVPLLIFHLKRYGGYMRFVANKIRTVSTDR